MSMVIAVREDGESGPFIGFQVDNEFLECSDCEKGATYLLRYTEDERRNLPKHRLAARRAIESEHPKHSDTFRVG